MQLGDLYARVREKEGRLYSDELVANLPRVPPLHPLASEWRAREDSARRLLRYMAGLARPLEILDLGCGNGWLSHHMAGLGEARVFGLDRLSRELAQASRLFAARNLAFLSADIFDPPFRSGAFPVIILASVVQYFRDLPGLIRALRPILAHDGEIHLLDSPLYRELDLEAARRRTRAYYAGLGIPEMADQYFHHAFEDLEEFSPDYLYLPDGWRARLSRAVRGVNSPFPWLRIRKSDIPATPAIPRRIAHS